jgi:pantetheine-phosphate adenylyltransferase
METSSYKIAVFPGSFDPITVGHESIINRALPLFDKIIIVIAVNADKKNKFPIENRVQWIKQVFSKTPKIEVTSYDGLTVNFCQEVGAKYILRGLRTSADFEFERFIGQTNKMLNSEIETVFMLTLPEHSFITSSVVRDIYTHKGDITPFIPKSISREF